MAVRCQPVFLKDQRGNRKGSFPRLTIYGISSSRGRPRLLCDLHAW